MKTAKTIDEVILILEQIIVTETKANSNLVYFPVLYKQVTHRIKEGIEKNEFENNNRMEVLDVIFANRYIKAYFQLKNNETPSQSWANAFAEANNGKLLIMQHVLLGINAHINLDLGIAVAETVGENGDMANFENDFNKINEILASLVDGVQERIGRVSPLFYLLERFGKGKEDKIVTFSILIARDGAWLFANQYHFSHTKDLEFQRRDIVIGMLATKLTKTKSRWLQWVVKSIRWLENKDVPAVVMVLNS
ncbi:DUF5995 family protein [Rasiella sp. SM2506]|uniref:DUF5995 family protein n=1 Tax=Rasiella sp. SM2506 TaxID=3423914 RepID=UPI003D7A43EF